MKVGLRKPSIRKSIKARTTGKVKKAIKRSVNPLYGKKGMGYINNPKKAIYNKVYNKTTVGVRDIGRAISNEADSRNERYPVHTNAGRKSGSTVSLIIAAVVVILLILVFS